MEGNQLRGAGSHQGAGGSSRTWAVICHLSALAGWVLPGLGHLLGPLVVWLIKRGDDDFVDAHGKEAVNFQISWTLYTMALLIAAVVWFFPVAMGAAVGDMGPWEPQAPRLLVLLGFAGNTLVALAATVAWHLLIILAAFRASNGQAYRYPLTIRWIR